MLLRRVVNTAFGHFYVLLYRFVKLCLLSVNNYCWIIVSLLTTRDCVLRVKLLLLPATVKAYHFKFAVVFAAAAAVVACGALLLMLILLAVVHAYILWVFSNKQDLKRYGTSKAVLLLFFLLKNFSIERRTRKRSKIIREREKNKKLLEIKIIINIDQQVFFV